MRRGRDKDSQKKIATERIALLFGQAEQVFAKHPERATRYVDLARRIAMKLNVRLSSAYRRRFCSHCYVFLVPGTNARVRTREGKLVVYCLGCKKYTRIPLKKKVLA